MQDEREGLTYSPERGTVRLSLRTLEKDFDKSEDDIKALQSVGQIVGEVLKQLDDERCKQFRSSRAEETQRLIRSLVANFPQSLSKRALVRAMSSAAGMPSRRTNSKTEFASRST